MAVRHGIMVIGPAGGGKSTIVQCLASAHTAMTQVVHKILRMNPKAIRADEMFGETDQLSGEWMDGVFASMWAKSNQRTNKFNTWLVCDGPVDAIWIENRSRSHPLADADISNPSKRRHRGAQGERVVPSSLACGAVAPAKWPIDAPAWLRSGTGFAATCARPHS